MFNDSTNVSPFANIKNPFADRTTASTVKGYNRFSGATTVQYKDSRPHVEIKRVIGHGAFGKWQIISDSPPPPARVLGYVFEAVDKVRGVRVALKRTMKVGNVVSREYEVLSLLQGAPNVVQLVDFFYSIDQRQRVIQNTVMEFCECSLEQKLREHMESSDCIPLSHIKHYTRQLFAGLSQMHE